MSPAVVEIKSDRLVFQFRVASPYALEKYTRGDWTGLDPCHKTLRISTKMKAA